MFASFISSFFGIKKTKNAQELLSITYFDIWFLFVCYSLIKEN